MLRAEVGESLRVGVINGRVGTGIIRQRSSTEVTIEVTLTEDPPPDPRIELIVALPRPKVVRKLLAMAATFGLRRLVFVNARRVERSYFDSPVLAPDAVRRELVLGLAQGRETRLPEVLVRNQFRPFVEDEVATLWPGAVHRLMPHPTARQSIRALSVGGPCVVAIGPEGGWIPFEAEFLTGHGFEPLSLGPRILRVETAVPFAVGQILGQRD